MDETDTVLDVVNLSKHFGGGAAVENVTLRLRRGEVISLLGPSGCGKTTTLRCVAGFYRPDQGTITIGGRLVASAERFVAPEDRQIAMVFQNYVLWPHMTAFQNIAYGLKLRRLPRKEIAARVEEMIALLGLEGLAERYPHQLSGGQQQRVSVARSLVVRPQVLLLDEPFSNLDAKLRVQMRQEMRDLLSRLGTSALYVTHDQEEAMVLSDRILLMDRGRMIEEGTPQALFERPQTEFTARFFGVANFLPGVIEVENGVAALRLDAIGTRVDLPLVPATRAGVRHVLGLRPDALEVEPGSGRAPPWFEGRIRSRYYVGGAVELEVTGPTGRAFHCRVSDPASYGWPDIVSLRIRPDRAVLFPESVA